MCPLAPYSLKESCEQNPHSWGRIPRWMWFLCRRRSPAVLNVSGQKGQDLAFPFSSTNFTGGGLGRDKMLARLRDSILGPAMASGR